MSTHDDQAKQALSVAGAFCGECGFEPGDRGCPDCEHCYQQYVAALRAAGWAPRAEVLNEAADSLDTRVDAMRAEPRFKAGKGNTLGPGLLSATQDLRRMATTP